MFSNHETLLQKTTKEQIIATLFKDLIHSSLLPHESNTIIEKGLHVLKKAQTPLEFDQTLVGTLLYALYFNDLKYPSDHYGIQILNDAIFKVLAIWKSQSDLKNPGYTEHIAVIGKHALVDKTIPFYGQFSNQSKIASMISHALSHIKNNYFEAYGLSESMDLDEQNASLAFHMN